MSLKYQCLLEPGRIGTLNIPNRIVKAPQSTGLSCADGSVSERLIRHYRELARGGTGLIIVESAFIDTIASKSVHCQLNISKDETIAGLAWLAETIKEHHCRSAIQIEHCGWQKLLGTPPIKSASAVTWPALYDRVGSNAVPESLTIPEILTITEAFGNAAKRAQMAGFDLLEINGANGYLITNFLSPHTNKRDDIYGGPLENRLRFLVEVYDNIRSKVGFDYPVTVRLSGTDYEPDGFGIEETIEVCRILEAQGIDAVHVSGGSHNQIIHQVSPMTVPAGHNVWAAAVLKKEINVPVIASGSITTPELAEEIIISGKSDFVGLGRPLWADQYWVKKIKEGRPEDIRPCIRCNEGCLERSFFKFQSTGCSVNPTLGREGELEISRTERSKKVAVVGGGIAGMEAARVCALRGHQVTLFEKRKLGGALNEVATPRFKADIKLFVNYLITQVKKLEIPVVVFEATFETLKEGCYDTVLVATGAKPKWPHIPGLNRRQVCEVSEAFLRHGSRLGKSVIVIGGGRMGAEMALWLDEQEKRVVIIEPSDQILSDCGITDKIALGEKLAFSKIKIQADSRIEKIAGKGVTIENHGKKMEIPGDSVIMAIGHEPAPDLGERLREETSLEVYCIGGSVFPGSIFDAIRSAYKTALSI